MDFTYQANEEYINLLENKLDQPNLFSVVTWGCSGSTWFSKLLNSHPDIFCLHAFNQHLSLTTGTNADEGVSYLRSISISAHGYKLAGDIHGVNRDFIKDLKAYFKERFVPAILIRDPVNRLRSMWANTRIYDGGIGNYSYVKHFLQHVGYNGEYTKEIVLFSHAVNMLNAIIDEINGTDFIIELEKLNDTDYLKSTMERLSGNTLKVDTSWLYSTKIAPFNSHQKKEAIFKYSIDQKQLIAKILKDEAIKIYEEIGYDMNELIAIKEQYS